MLNAIIYISVVITLIAYSAIKDVLYTRERERLVVLLRAEKADVEKLVTPEKKPKTTVKTPRRRTFGEVKSGGDGKS